MQNPICPEHNLEAIVKSGIKNKVTGRLYPPFFGCPWRGTDENGRIQFCNVRFAEKPTQAELISTARATQTVAVDNKDKSIKYMNALNVVSALMAAGLIKDETSNPLIEWSATLKEGADIVFKMLPPE